MSKDDLQNKLRLRTGNAPWCVLFCPKCIPATLPLSDSVKRHISYDWAVYLQCFQCNASWHVCRQCSSQRKAFRNVESLYRHHNRFHQVKIVHSRKRSQSSINDIDDMHYDDSQHNSITINDTQHPPFLLANFNGIHNLDYFHWHHHGGFGASSLVSRSVFGTVDECPIIDPAHVAMHLSLATLVSSITRAQRDQLADVLRYVSQVSVIQHENSVCDVLPTRIPQSSSDLRSLYILGKDAMVPNLPRPNVQIVNDHAYVSLKECVADLLGHGLPLSYIDVVERGCNFKVENINQSSFAQKIHDHALKYYADMRKVVCLYVVEWSDGFDPTSGAKNNRGSCWVKTVTISPPPCSEHLLSHTYPIALGIESDSHEAVEKLFSSELSEFRAGQNITFYLGGKRCNAVVHLDLLATLQDQPERRSANFLMLGGSKFHSQWGLSLDVAAVSSLIPSCNNCFHNHFRSCDIFKKMPHCNDCVNWDTSGKHALLQFTPPPHFPLDQIPYNGQLQPMTLSYDLLKAAMKMAEEGFLHRGWSLNNVKSYLRVHGLNNEILSSFAEYLSRVKNAAIGTSSKTWSNPVLWERGTTLNQHVDVVMHLLFLGVIKTTMQMVHEWMKKRGKCSTFISYTAGTLETIQQLGLRWCQCIPYKSGKLGGWVSENYVAASKLMTWLYCSIGIVAADGIYVEPQRPYHSWTKIQNTAFLQSRGLSAVGNASELKSRVNDLFQQPGGPPPVLPPLGGNVKVVHEMLVALKAMVSHVMAKEFSETNIDELDYHIKFFLNKFEQFDKGMRGHEDKPTWLTSYNFLCLLNIPKNVKEFGPVRNLWEGGGMGEKIITKLKPMWLGFRKNWHYNMLQKLLQQLSLDRVRESFMNSQFREAVDVAEKVTTMPLEHQVLIKRNVYIYPNLGSVHEAYNTRKPISFLRLSDASFWVIIKKNMATQFTCHKYIDNFGGDSYHEWGVDCVTHNFDEIICNKEITNFCLLLPLLKEYGMPNCTEDPWYTLIDSEWNVIDEQQNIVKPSCLLREN